MEDDTGTLLDTPCAGCPYDAGYVQLSQREGTAEKRAWHWQIAFWAVVGLAVPTLLSQGWYLHTVPAVQSFVQLVQITTDGRVLPLGSPKEALAYEPQEAQWHTMLREWVDNVRWRDSGAIPLLKHRWQLAGHMTCPSASQALAEEEQQLQPFTPSKRKTSLRILSVTKTPVPRAYNVLWEETTVEGSMPAVDSHWHGTFTVGRVVPKNPVLNPLGLCVESFALRKQS